MKFNVGDIVKISDGSGIDSNKIVTVVDRSKIKTDGSGVPTNVSGAYKTVDWNTEVAFQYENGSYGTMFKSRLTKVFKTLHTQEEKNKLPISLDKVNEISIYARKFYDFQNRKQKGYDNEDVKKEIKKIFDIREQWVLDYLVTYIAEGWNQYIVYDKIIDHWDYLNRHEKPDYSKMTNPISLEKVKEIVKYLKTNNSTTLGLKESKALIKKTADIYKEKEVIVNSIDTLLVIGRTSPEQIHEEIERAAHGGSESKPVVRPTVAELYIIAKDLFDTDRSKIGQFTPISDVNKDYVIGWAHRWGWKPDQKGEITKEDAKLVLEKLKEMNASSKEKEDVGYEEIRRYEKEGNESLNTGTLYGAKALFDGSRFEIKTKDGEMQFMANSFDLLCLAVISTKEFYKVNEPGLTEKQLEEKIIERVRYLFNKLPK